MVSATPLFRSTGATSRRHGRNNQYQVHAKAGSLGRGLAGINNRSRASWLGVLGGAGVGVTPSVSRTGKIHIPVLRLPIRPWGSIPSLC